MGQEARAQLNEYVFLNLSVQILTRVIPFPEPLHLLTTSLPHRHAKVLQDSLLEIFNRIEAVKHEHDKLDNNNKFLQKYIGDLMSTSKITSTGASGRKK